MITSKPITVNFRNYGEITIPQGTRLTNLTALGKDDKYLFVDEFEWIEREYPAICIMLKHDATYYGIRIDKNSI